MKLSSQARQSILRRIAEIDPELHLAEAAVRGLVNRDPAMSKVVIRGASLSLERAGLERRLQRDDAE